MRKTGKRMKGLKSKSRGYLMELTIADMNHPNSDVHRWSRELELDWKKMLGKVNEQVNKMLGKLIDEGKELDNQDVLQLVDLYSAACVAVMALTANHTWLDSVKVSYRGAYTSCFERQAVMLR
jgi:hypothetical protein